MTYDDFLGKVQAKARLSSPEDAVNASRATLTTLSERLFGGESGDLASQLPAEIRDFVDETANKNEDFGLEEFFNRVTDREGVERSDAVHHARAVVDVVKEAVSAGEFADVLDQLPPDYAPLIAAGSEGKMKQ